MERNLRKTQVGMVSSDKMDKTVVVTVKDRVRHPLYKKIVNRTVKIKAHLRREGRLNTKKANVIKIGEIKLNKESFEVFKNDELIMLSTKEFELLRYLMENAGIVLSKEQIYQSVWKNNYGDIGTVAVNIKSLRNKLDTDEKYIKTIWGMGYKFVKDAQ